MTRRPWRGKTKGDFTRAVIITQAGNVRDDVRRGELEIGPTTKELAPMSKN